jgi:Zn-dependent M28 family amino/carboxypeptidase
MVEDLQHNLQSHLAQMTRDRDPFFATAGHFYAQHYIHEQLSQWGNVTSHEFEFRGRTHQNLILDLPHSDLPHSQATAPILIGAHYDTVPGSPGADDNATGVAVLLEIARAIAIHPARSPVRLVAFDLEELGVGSKLYAEFLKQQGQKLRLMMSLEMLGYCDRTPNSQRYPASFLKRFYPSSGDFIALIGNLKTIPDLIRLSHMIRKSVSCEWLPVDNRGLLLPDTRRSDHAHFWDQGYKAVMVTDTADLRNPHYHRGSDRIDTLDLPFLTGVCQGLIESVRLL